MMKKILCVLLTTVILLGILPIQIVATETEEPTSITFGLFSDLHYKEGMYISSVADLNAIMQRANDADADFVMQVGDFSNDWKGSPEIVNAYLDNSYDLPVYGVYGNHELESSGNSMDYVTPRLTNDQNVVWGTADGKIGDGSIAYYYYDIKGFRIVCTDTNYSYNPTTLQWEHNKTNSYGAPEGNTFEHSFGPTQLAWIETVLTDAANKSLRCIFFSHASVSSSWAPCPDTNKVQAIFARVNAIKKGTVMMAINGHLHTNHVEMKDGVLYLDMNTVRNGAWIGNQSTHHYNTEKFTKATYDTNGAQTGSSSVNVSSLTQAMNTWFFDAPLSAIVTVSSDGSISINGSTANWLGGIVPSIASGTSTGTTPQVSSVIEISTADELKKVGRDANYPQGVYYKLTANIDLGGEDWTPIPSFSGTFDGNGYTISNFKITNTSMTYVGFFSEVATGATVKNLTIADAEVDVATNSAVRDVAVLVANLGGTIENCKIENDVSVKVGVLGFNNTKRIGGICGYVGGKIACCENNASITCAANPANKIFMGGIGGMAVSTIDHCINNGAISMTANTIGWSAHLGGILGGTATWSADATVSNCVNTGAISTNNANPCGGIIGCVSNSGKAVVNNNYNFGTVTLTDGNGAAAGQIIGFETAACLTSSSNNYALEGGAAISGFTSGGAAVTLNATLDTEANLKAQATYKAIVAEVAEHLTGISTDLYGYQTTKANEGKFDLRLVATLSGDYTKLTNVGFKVEATYTGLDGKKETVETVTKLYNSITATSEGEETATEHTATSLGGDYIFVLACKGIPAEAENLTFTVTTFHTVKGATESVYATAETFVVKNPPTDTLPTT